MFGDVGAVGAAAFRLDDRPVRRITPFLSSPGRSPASHIG